jgi:hypothetical protein
VQECGNEKAVRYLPDGFFFFDTVDAGALTGIVLL